MLIGLHFCCTLLELVTTLSLRFFGTPSYTFLHCWLHSCHTCTTLVPHFYYTFLHYWPHIHYTFLVHIWYTLVHSARLVTTLSLHFFLVHSPTLSYTTDCTLTTLFCYTTDYTLTMLFCYTFLHYQPHLYYTLATLLTTLLVHFPTNTIPTTLWLRFIATLSYTFGTLPYTTDYTLTMLFWYTFLHFLVLHSPTPSYTTDYIHFPTIPTTLWLHIFGTLLVHLFEKKKPQHLGFPCGPPPWY